LAHSDNRIHILPVTNVRAKRKRGANGGIDITGPQRRWLSRGMAQAGGKLPLFDEEGQKYNEQTIRSCLSKGWAEPWFSNPIKPDWLICRLTETGRLALLEEVS